MADEKTLNEKYFNVYVEVLSQTLQQQVLSNISLQTKSKLNDDVLKEYQNEVGILQQEIQKINSASLEKETELKNQIEKLRADSVATQSERDRLKNEEINNLKNQIQNLHLEINRLNVFKAENETMKLQLVHIETYRNDILKTQEIVKQKDVVIKELNEKKDVVIKELNEQIEYLKLTPAKRKKVDLDKVAKKEPEKIETPKIEVPKEVLSATPKAKIIKQELPKLVVKDGGSF
jgi:DNA repair exonuclease SbcCD ATPase subunit